MNEAELLQDADLAARLSRRQIECLRLVARGYTSKEIARQVGLSPSTVDNHIRAAVDRLGAKNRTDAARLLLGRASDPLQVSDPLVGDGTGRERGDRPFSLLDLPPMGGRRNRLTSSRRSYHILQIAALAVAICAAIILTISGVVHVLG